MLKTPKVLIISKKYRFSGGSERMALLNSEILKESGFEVSVASGGWPANTGVDHILIKNFYCGRLWRDISFYHSCQRILNKRDFSVSISSLKIPGIDIYRAGDGTYKEFLKYTKNFKSLIKTILSKLDPFYSYTLRQEQMLFSNPNLKTIIAVSQMVKDEIVKNYNIPGDMIQVVYSPVDHLRFKRQKNDLRAQYGVSEHELVFLFVGSGFARKGLHVALQALAGMSNKSAQLWVVGYDKNINSYKRFSRKLGIEKRVRFLGTTRDVVPFYHASDVFLFPSYNEPAGMVVMEAMASGLPVIVSKSAGYSELVVHGESGYVVDCSCPQEISRYMDEFGQRERVSEMGSAAEEAIQAYSHSRYQSQFIKIIEATCAQSKK